MGKMGQYYDEMKEDNNWDEADEHFKKEKQMREDIWFSRNEYMYSWGAAARIVNRYLMDRIISEKGKRTEWEYIQFLQQELDHVDLWLQEKLEDGEV